MLDTVDMHNFKRDLHSLNISTVAENCTRCQLCQKECSFLQKYGLPGELAEQYFRNSAPILQASFSCSLCGLCAAVCPVFLEPSKMFLALRREAYAVEKGNYSGHAGILNYEKRGLSKRYTWYSLPAKCKKVFFPGCNLPGSRPDKIEKLYTCLQDVDATIGIVLDCCSKPSHDLGRQYEFEQAFFELRDYLVAMGVTTVIVACPNCHKVFSEYGKGLTITTIYEYLLDFGLIENKKLKGEITLHDPCAVRFSVGLHAAIRTILLRQGYSILEMPHNREQTFCCGEGGAVGAREPALAEKWTHRRVAEAQGRLIVTYCGGCTSFLGRKANVGHIFDVLFEPQATLTGKIRSIRAPFTYLNRIRLKKRLQKQSINTLTRERPIGILPAETNGHLVSNLGAGFLKVIIMGSGFLAGLAILFWM